MKTKKLLWIVSLAIMLTSCTSGQNKTVAAPEDQGEKNLTETVTELMMSRRSIRQYKDQTISRDTLDQILKCGINAPNGMNRQSYEIRVIDNPALVQEISDVVVAQNPKIGERPNFKNIFSNAPCVIFIGWDSSYDMSQIDCGLLGENIILSAWSMGIGTCCLGGAPRMMKDTPAAAPYIERLGFSEGYELLYAIGLGYPDESPDAKPRDANKIKYVE